MRRLKKHRNNTDVAIEVLKSYYIKEKDEFLLKVEWWNIGECHPPYSMGFIERLRIPRKTWQEDWEWL